VSAAATVDRAGARPIVTLRRPLHPAAWIAWATFGGIVTFTTTNPWYLAVLWAVSWFVYASQRVDGPASRSFRVFLYFGLVTMGTRSALVVFQTVDVANVVFALLEGFRLATLLVVFGTFNAVTDPFGVLRLAPRRFHEPALAAALALSIVPKTIAASRHVREAQAMRGIEVRRWRTLPALAVPILESGMEDAVTLAESMDSRGHGRGRRSRYRPQPWTAAGVAVALTALAAAAAFLVAGARGFGDLHPSTDPLERPVVAPILIVAICLLALPGLLRRSRT
jgi:energy-coupling factor transport system permease protein